MLKNLTLSAKITGQLVIQIVLLILCGIAGISGLSVVYQNQEDITLHMVPGMNYLRAASVDIHQALLAERVVCVTDPMTEEYRSHLKDYEKNMSQAEKRYKSFLLLNNDTSLNKSIEKFEIAYRAWEPFSRDIVRRAGIEKGKMPLLALSLGEGAERFDVMESSLDEIADTIMEHIIAKTELSAKSHSSTRMLLYTIISLSIVIGLVISYVLFRTIFRTLGGEPQIMAVMAQNIAEGNLLSTITDKSTKAVGLYASMIEMSNYLRGMIMNLSKNSQKVAETSQNLAKVFDQLASGVEQTSNKSATVATAVDEMSAHSNTVAAAAEQVANNVNIVATAVEAMALNINGISANAYKTSEMTEKAAETSSIASERVNELGEAAQQITKVTETITEISEQTNLLALNATIEAARAGDAGKGFAVVANEIKELAKQTSEATLEIKKQIESVQTSTAATVDGIRQVNQLIGDANAMSSTIASDVEEQAATTAEIATNVSQASTGIQEVTDNIAQISQVARGIATEISDVDQVSSDLYDINFKVKSSAIELNTFSEALIKEVSKFKF